MGFLSRFMRVTPPDVFLNRLDWMACSGEMGMVTEFSIDVYRFRMDEPVSGNVLADFIAFLKTLDMRWLGSVKMVFVWLYQRGMGFRLSFRWNRCASVRYNLSRLGSPRRITKELMACGRDDLMSCPLDKIRDDRINKINKNNAKERET